MNALVKKEIRLLLPSWIAAVLLAMVQAITRPYDFYVASLLFFGLTIMALTTIGREASLNTFSAMLAQPAERIRIWKTKLSVLAAAFFSVFVLWLVAFGIAWWNSSAEASDAKDSYNLFITVCLIATATFTGGLWTTLLLRQIAGAFWLTLLVPAVLSGFSGIFLADSESGSLVIAVLAVVIGIYSIAGFLFARWLFFRAQDVGWSGGVIAMPEWKFFTARAGDAGSIRNRKPIFALIKKEFQLQQVSLLGAAGLLVLHVGTIVLRAVHHFDEKSAGASAGAFFVACFWILWLVMAPVIGSMAVAEERRLGVMEGQLCLPVSRRVQFVIKAFLTLFLGIFLGGVVPVLMEKIGGAVSGGQSVFTQPENGYLGLGIVAFAAWLTFVSFFASTLAKSFLQAVGFGIATFIGCVLVVPLFANGRMLFLDSTPALAILPLVIAVPTIIATLFWLAYLNFNNFRDDWALWRRNLGGIVGALLFIFISSNAIYHRAWEIFEPAEPAHGPAKFSLVRPPALHLDNWENLIARLPDGRVRCDHLRYSEIMFDSHKFDLNRLKWLWVSMVDPLPRSAGAGRFVAGSNYVSATVRHIDYETTGKEANVTPHVRITGFLDTVGVKADGTLWISDASSNGAWTGDKMNRFGDATDWRQVVRLRDAILLLKTDGTLWSWGTNHFDLSHWQRHWPTLRNYQPHQIGTAADWKEIYDGTWKRFIRKTDGSVWKIGCDDKSGEYEFGRVTNLDQVSFRTLSFHNDDDMAYVRPDGTLWVSWGQQQNGKDVSSGFIRAGTDTNWTAVMLTWHRMVALKSDGSLWQWNFNRIQRSFTLEDFVRLIQKPPTRVGIHNDWIAITKAWNDVVALAADGSLWFWPDREQYEQSTLLQLPKQPRFLGNVFSTGN